MSEYDRTHPLWNREAIWIVYKAHAALDYIAELPHDATSAIVKADELHALRHELLNARRRVVELEGQAVK